jgi:hypothetical protein
LGLVRQLVDILLEVLFHLLTLVITGVCLQTLQVVLLWVLALETQQAQTLEQLLLLVMETQPSALSEILLI